MSMTFVMRLSMCVVMRLSILCLCCCVDSMISVCEDCCHKVVWCRLSVVMRSVSVFCFSNSLISICEDPLLSVVMRLSMSLLFC